jgi:hypothetical protein
MRPLSELIAEVKFHTNNTKGDHFTDESLIRMFDSAQREIQRTIFNAYPTDAIFAKEKVYTIGTSAEFTLPSDIFTPNSIYRVQLLKSGLGRSEPLTRLSPSENTREVGYELNGNKLKIEPASTIPNYQYLSLLYCPILQRLTSVSDVSGLSTICEEYMTMFVERKIHYVMASKSVQNSAVFTAEEKKDIAALFAGSARDVKRIPTLNSEYINY